MNKLISWVCVISVITILTTGNSEAVTSDTLTLWTFEPYHVEFYKQCEKDYNKKHPDKPLFIDAKWSKMFETSITTSLTIVLNSGKGAPDLCDIEITRVPSFLGATKIHFIPINDIVDPVKTFFDSNTLIPYRKNNIQYGTPHHIGITVMYYNKEILAQAKVNVDSIDTWDDFIKAGKQVVSKTKKPMIDIESGDIFTPLAIMTQRGSNFVDKNGNPVTNNEINVSTMQFLYDLINKDSIAIVSPGGFHHADEYYRFMDKGGSASILMPIWYMTRFLDHMPDLKGKMIVRPLPRWEKGGVRSAGLGGTGTFITDQCTKVELAKAFLKEAKLTKEANVRIWNVMGFDPPRVDVYNELLKQPPTKYTRYFVNGNAIVSIMTQLINEINPVNYGALFPLIIGKFQSETAYNILVDKTQTPQNALDQLQQELLNAQIHSK
jgi:arabinosaccharide transport system substrate-binding protein